MTSSDQRVSFRKGEDAAGVRAQRVVRWCLVTQEQGRARLLDVLFEVRATDRSRPRYSTAAANHGRHDRHLLVMFLLNKDKNKTPS